MRMKFCVACASPMQDIISYVPLWLGVTDELATLFLRVCSGAELVLN
jgi:hypothetical protein